MHSDCPRSCFFQAATWLVCTLNSEATWAFAFSPHSRSPDLLDGLAQSSAEFSVNILDRLPTFGNPVPLVRLEALGTCQGETLKWKSVAVFFLAAVAALAADARAVTVAWSRVGSPGNANDGTGYGAVGCAYNIGTYDVANSQ